VDLISLWNHDLHVCDYANLVFRQGTPADNMRMHEDDDVNDNEEEEALPLLEEGDSEHGYNFEEVD
jgi:hypothetical protein